MSVRVERISAMARAVARDEKASRQLTMTTENGKGQRRE